MAPLCTSDWYCLRDTSHDKIQTTHTKNITKTCPSLPPLQHCLLDLLELLSAEDLNLNQLLDREFVNAIIKYASLAHLNPDQIGNVLARATNNTLMLKDASPAASAGTNAGSTVPTAATTLNDDERTAKRSMWIPEDSACPRVWFVAPQGQMPPPQQVQKGPFRITELLNMLDLGTITGTWLAAPSISEDADSERFEALVDTGRWKPLGDYFQLRMQMLFPGKAVYSPAEVAAKGLNMLNRLAAVHHSANSKSIPFYPIPTSKRIMSESEHLSIFSQLLLSNDVNVVEIAAQLLHSLVEFNQIANSKLYLSGAFFFACRYTGNNFLPLARLFDVSHLQQSFHDAAASVARELPLGVRSVLGNILPTALITILVNYGADRFASIFTGDFDSPEVIWNSSLRKHVVDMIEQHVGDFYGRLRQYNLARYEYCPIPKIHFATLDKEIYVFEYYLRNLCDEARFPSWPIGDPLLLLRETIERWREEMIKGVVDSAVTAAKKTLNLPERFDNEALRKSYKVCMSLSKYVGYIYQISANTHLISCPYTHAHLQRFWRGNTTQTKTPTAAICSKRSTSPTSCSRPSSCKSQRRTSATLFSSSRRKTLSTGASPRPWQTRNTPPTSCSSAS